MSNKPISCDVGGGVFAARCVSLHCRRTQFDTKQCVQKQFLWDTNLHKLFYVKMCVPALQKHTTRGKHTATNVTRKRLRNEGPPGTAP